MKRKACFLLVLLVLLQVSVCWMHTTVRAEVVGTGKCGPNATWSYDSDGTLTISGTGEITSGTWYIHHRNNINNFVGIKKVVIEEGITALQNYAFEQYAELEEVVLPSTLKSIGSMAFFKCYNLKELSIPAAVESIGLKAFDNTSLEVLNVENLENWLLMPRDKTQRENYMTVENLHVNGVPVAEIVFPASCQYAWPGLFCGVNNLKKVVLPETVLDVCTSAFYDCNGLEEVILPKNLKHLRKYTFGFCDSLTTLTIPAGVVTVDSYVFAEEKSEKLTNNQILNPEEESNRLSNIQTLYFEGSAPLFAAYAFDSVRATVYYPANDSSWTPQVRQDYGGQINWVPDSSLPGGSPASAVLDSGTCGPNATWSISNTGVLTISGTGEVTEHPWSYDYQGVIQKVKVEEGITALGSIGSEVIGYCFGSAYSLKEVILPESLLWIGRNCFSRCINLKEIVIPDNVYFIGDQAFACCGLESIRLPKNLQALTFEMFSDCRNLKKLTIPASVKTVEGYTFNSMYVEERTMDEIRFLGNAPEFPDGIYSAFVNLKATVLVPAGNATWLECLEEQYRKITWVVDDSHYYDPVVTLPTCTTSGQTTWTCVCGCGDSYVTDITSPLPHQWGTGTCAEPRKCTVCGTASGTKDGHIYDNKVDGICNDCGIDRVSIESRKVVHMFRMYNPNTGEHFYTGSTVERDNLIGHGWHYEGVGFTFPANTGAPVHRLFQPSTGEHLYTMDENEKAMLVRQGWEYEGIAFNSAYDTEAVQHRLHNPNATVGAYHFTFSEEEMQNLINAGWEYQGIGWYSCWK